MVIVDSCGWLEWFTGGTLADQYKQHLHNSDKLIVPAIIIYEVYKILKREAGEEKALLATGYLKNLTIIPFDDTLALKAADISVDHKLTMADAIIYATTLTYDCLLVTSDIDLKGLPSTKFIPKK